MALGSVENVHLSGTSGEADRAGALNARELLNRVKCDVARVGGV